MLSVGRFSSLAHFDQQAENYKLEAGMYVDREELIARRTAKLILRPQLSVNGIPISRTALEDVELDITSTDLDGVATTKEVPDFKLFADREKVYEFQVPQRLANIRFTLKAKIQNLSQNKKIDLSADQTFAINDVDRTERTADMHFARVGRDYVIDLLGKTGEPQPDRVIHLQFKLRDFTQMLHTWLATDAHGEVNLGGLAGVTTVTATDPQGNSHAWTLLHDDHTYPQTIQGEADSPRLSDGSSAPQVARQSPLPIEVPYMGRRTKPDRSELSLLEMRGDQFVADRFDNISLSDDMLSLVNLPAGDYSLLLKRAGREIHIRLTDGQRRGNYIMGDYRKLEVRNEKPLQIAPR